MSREEDGLLLKAYSDKIKKLIVKYKAGKPLNDAEREMLQTGPGRPRHHAESLPVYDSMAACHGQAHVPMALMKAAKQAGCSAFLSNRVALGPLLKWYWVDRKGVDESSGSWKDRKERASALREENKLKKELDQVVDIAELQPTLRNVLLHFRATLQRTLETELPARIRNKSEAEIRAECRAAVDKCLKILREGTSQWTAEPVKS